MCLFFVCLSGFYYTSLDNRVEPSSPPASSSSSSSSSEAAVVEVPVAVAVESRDADDRQRCSAGRRDVAANVCRRSTRRSAHVPLEQRLAHHLSVVVQSHDRRRSVDDGRDLRPSAATTTTFCRDDDPSFPSTADSCDSPSAPSLALTEVRRAAGRRRRRDCVAETSFTELPSSASTSSSSLSAAARHHDIAVQVSLPRRPAVPAALPLTGRLGRAAAAVAPLSHRSPSAAEHLVDSAPAAAPAQSSLTTAAAESAGLGGSMPCLSPLPCGDEELSLDDEGYMTKDRNTSTLSVNTARRLSPVFF